MKPAHPVRGRRDEARGLHDRLESLHSTSALYLDAMGCRIHYLSLEGRFEDAGRLMGAMLQVAAEDDASPRQRLTFYAGCMRAIAAARSCSQRT